MSIPNSRLEPQTTRVTARFYDGLYELSRFYKKYNNQDKFMINMQSLAAEMIAVSGKEELLKKYASEYVGAQLKVRALLTSLRLSETCSGCTDCCCNDFMFTRIYMIDLIVATLLGREKQYLDANFTFNAKLSIKISGYTIHNDRSTEPKAQYVTGSTEGKCMYNSSGCILPEDLRPFICATYSCWRLDNVAAKMELSDKYRRALKELDDIGKKIQNVFGVQLYIKGNSPIRETVYLDYIAFRKEQALKKR